MKKILLLALICCSFYYKNSLAQTCTECKERVMIIYDNDVKIPEPDYGSMTVSDQIKAFTEWTNLYYIAGGIRNYVRKDPTADCFHRLDAAFFTQPDSINTTIKTGVGHPNIPPATGSLASGDYIIYGVVTGGGTNYNLQLKLETAKSRELVKEFNIPFARGFDPITTGYNAALNLAPLYTMCLDFEKKKRDEGPPFAIHPILKVKPEKTKIDPAGSTNVEFTLTDCDDVPLKNRVVEIMADAGSFDSSTLTSDESGKCTARYTAGNDAGTVQVICRLSYRHPTQNPESRYDEDAVAYIKVGETPDWIVEGDFSFEEHVTFEQTIGESTQINSETIRKNRGLFSAVLDMKTHGPGIYTTDKTVSEEMTGMAFEAFTERSLTNASDENMSIYQNSVSTSYCETLPKMNWDQEVNININAHDRHFAFTTHTYPQTGGGQSNSLSIICQDGNCHTNSSSEIIECATDSYEDGMHSYNIDRVGSQDTTYTEVTHLSAGVTITTEVQQLFREDGIKFYFQLLEKVTTEQITANSKHITTTKEFADICVNSWGAPSGINRINSPGSTLSQNSPNPFYPETTIRYSLTKPGTVRLSVVDIYGREVQLLENTFKYEGNHSVNFNASNLKPGVYFCKLTCDGFSSTKKMLLLNETPGGK
jgi:hypothetical protein